MAKATAVKTAPETPVAATEATQVQEAAPVAAQKKAKGVVSTGNYIQDIAIKIEGLSKVKALNSAKELAETIETSYFELGGVLKVIKEQSWFEGAEDFGTYVTNSFGFKARKADYLIEIYSELVGKQIPWEKVKDLGWTKLKDLAKILTPENVDEWVEKASGLTVKELQALLSGGDGEGGTQKTTDNITKVTLKFHPDQAETWNSAIAKAKGELDTDVDTVAADAIAMNYLGNGTVVAGPGDLSEQLKTMGIDAAIEVFNAAFPEAVLSLDPAGEAAATA